LFFCTNEAFTQSDTLKKKELSFEEYQEWVLKYHPIARQSDLLIDWANADLLKAKGHFDPKLFYDINAKNFDDKLYYRYGNGGVKWSSPVALEFKSGYENNTGVFLSDENKLPNGGLMYTQISLPILQGLVIDERRAALNQAKIYNQMSRLERQQMIFDLLLKSGKAYLDWQLAFQNFQVYELAYNISKDRFEGIVQTVEWGDRPAIDTVEAKIQLQDRWLNWQQAQLELQNKQWLLSGFLWSENNEPVVLQRNVVPKLKVDLEAAEALAVRFDTEKE
jgi:outer membrane protein TolC